MNCMKKRLSYFCSNGCSDIFLTKCLSRIELTSVNGCNFGGDNMSKVFRGKGVFAFSFILLFLMLLFPCNITAKAANTDKTSKDIQLNVKRKSLVVGTNYNLKVYNLPKNHKVSYKSNSQNIATVNQKGTVTGKKVGKATITITVKNGFKTVANLDCKITVGPPAISIKLTKSGCTLLIGERTSLKGILKPNNTVEKPKYVSSNTKIASVSPTGRVTAKAVGHAYIYAIIDNEKKDFCKVIVTAR